MKTNHDDVELRELFIEELGEVTGGVAPAVWHGGERPPLTTMAINHSEQGPTTGFTTMAIGLGEEGPTSKLLPAQDTGSFFRGIDKTVDNG